MQRERLNFWMKVVAIIMIALMVLPLLALQF
jgi:hypothetical protein